MKSFIIYIVEFLLCSGLFLVLYRSLIVGKSSHGFCRKFLIITMLLSAIIPAMNVPLYPQKAVHFEVPAVVAPVTSQTTEKQPEEVETTQTTTTVQVPEPVVVPRFTAEEKLMYGMFAVYFLVMLISLTLIVRTILFVSRLKRQSTITIMPHYQLAVSDKVETPFSFLRTIFIRADHNPLERSQIISHEAGHIAHHHSIEKLFMSVLRSLFWFNPFLWIAEKWLEEVQEWQADKDALADGYDVESYRLTIVRQLFGYNPELVSGATNSLTKTRLMKMKQTDYQGSKILQLAATVVLTSALFLSFGCGQSNPKTINEEDANIYFDCDRAIFTADRFYSFDVEGVTTRINKDVVSRDMFGRVANGIEIFENYVSNSKTEPNPTITIAVNGIKTAETPDSRELCWVGERTNIIIDGKKSDYATFKSLKPHDYKEIYYYREEQPSANYRFVYVAKDMSMVYAYNYTVGIDLPGEKRLPNLIVNPSFGYRDNIFVYSTSGYNEAAPLAKFAVDGKLTDYNTWREKMHESFSEKAEKEGDIIIYRNDEAKKFGDDIFEVVELRTLPSISVRYQDTNFIQAPDRELIPYLDVDEKFKPSNYVEIRAAIEKSKAENRKKGLTTIVTLDETTPEKYYKEFIENINITDPDITFIYNRFDYADNIDLYFNAKD